jgi:hypothetical protein
MPLDTAAESGASVLTGSELFLILNVSAAADPAHGYIRIYGYVL